MIIYETKRLTKYIIVSPIKFPAVAPLLPDTKMLISALGLSFGLVNSCYSFSLAKL